MPKAVTISFIVVYNKNSIFKVLSDVSF